MTLKEDLANLIHLYFQRDKKRNISSLSSRSGVPYSTVRDMVNQEYLKPNNTHVFAILNVVCKDTDRALSFIKAHYPKLYPFFEKTFSQENYQLVGDGLLYRLGKNNIETLIIAMLTAVDEGVSKDDVIRALGDRATKPVERLLDEGSIREVNSRLRLPAVNWSCIDLVKVYNQIKHFLDETDPEDNETALALVVMGLNSEGQKVATSMINNFRNQLEELANDAKFQGNKTVYACAFTGKIGR